MISALRSWDCFPLLVNRFEYPILVDARSYWFQLWTSLCYRALTLLPSFSLLVRPLVSGLIYHLLFYQNELVLFSARDGLLVGGKMFHLPLLPLYRVSFSPLYETSWCPIVISIVQCYGCYILGSFGLFWLLPHWPFSHHPWAVRRFYGKNKKASVNLNQ